MPTLVVEVTDETLRKLRYHATSHDWLNAKFPADHPQRTANAVASVILHDAAATRLPAPPPGSKIYEDDR